MRRLPLPLTLLLAVLASCGAEVPPAPAGPMVPDTLAVLTLARESDEITPIVFPHRGHAERAVAEGEGCVSCHHALADPGREDPEGPPPRRCRTCHDPEESEVAEGDPPDL